jgi:hypothetical protein
MVTLLPRRMLKRGGKERKITLRVGVETGEEACRLSLLPPRMPFGHLPTSFFLVLFRPSRSPGADQEGSGPGQ